MTTRCIKCHRKLTRPPINGMGPVCAKAAKPIPTVERDLFGFNITLATEAALARVAIHIESLAVEARIAIRHEAAAARRRLGIWAA